MNLAAIKAVPVQRKHRKRVGRGPGSGHGKTAGRGHKGYKARSGSSRRLGYEGGQMPLFRRLPKRGFNNAEFKKQYAIVNLGQLERFGLGEKVTPESLLETGIIKNLRDGLKVLGDGELTKALTVAAHCFSESAKKKIEGVGGKVEILSPKPEAQGAAPAVPKPKPAQAKGDEAPAKK